MELLLQQLHALAEGVPLCLCLDPRDQSESGLFRSLTSNTQASQGLFASVAPAWVLIHSSLELTGDPQACKHVQDTSEAHWQKSTREHNTVPTAFAQACVSSSPAEAHLRAQSLQPELVELPGEVRRLPLQRIQLLLSRVAAKSHERVAVFDFSARAQSVPLQIECVPHICQWSAWNQRRT